MGEALSSAAPKVMASRGIVCAAVVFGLVGTGQFFSKWDRYHWDFRVYWAAGAAANEGLNPYEVTARQQVLPSVDPTLPFVYPPLALLPLRVFSRLPFSVANVLWLVLKGLALGALLWLWNRFFVPLLAHPWAPIFLVAGLSGTLAVDFVTGNISIFEQLVLWSAFALLLQGRVIGFAALVVVLAQWKLIPVAFLALLGVVPSRPRWGVLGMALAVFAAFLAGSTWLWPDQMQAFLLASTQLPERGHLNPSLAALTFDLVEALGYPWKPLPRWLPWVVYVAGVLGVLTLTATALRQARRQGNIAFPLHALFLGCATFAIIAPRMMGYSLILLIPVALHALKEGWGAGASNAWLWVLLLFPAQTILPVFQLLHTLAQEYLLYFVSLALWWVYWRASVQSAAHQQVV